MKKTIILIFTIFFALAVNAQFFEGRITYRNTYISKMPNVTSAQFTSMIGATQEYYIKGGNYKSVMNGNLFEWQLYRQADNKLYNKMKASDNLLWNDGAENNDEVLKAEINKGVTTILGYTCDELVLTCKSGVQKYYYSDKLGVDPSVFAEHKFGNWYDYVSRAKALSLKSVVESAQFTLVMEATEVKPMKLSDEFFVLPAGAKTVKSPY